MDEITKNLPGMFKEGKGKYFLINVVARRARALNQGARPAVPYQEGASDPMQTAVEELLAGKIQCNTSSPTESE
jgi:DNA-directed RNA polymerase subunit K/omega